MMLVNPALPSWKFSSPMTNSRWKVPKAYPPLLNPPPNQKNPPENACTLPNNHYYV